jgi:hypothetical protein
MKASRLDRHRHAVFLALQARRAETTNAGGVNHRILVYIRPKAWRADTEKVVPALRAFAVHSFLYRAFTGPAMTVSASGLSERAL